MKNVICTVGIFMFSLLSVTAQDLGNYQYVKVPEKFEFQSSENQYQLNALTAFLFDKFNFTPLYKESVPEGVDPCEVLTADVHNESGLFRTKVYVTLENCQNDVVFTSKTGMSREKDFKRSFQEALRNAFQSVEALDHQYIGEVVVSPKLPGEELATLDQEKDTTPERIGPPRTANKVEKNSGSEVLHYTNGAQAYVLIQTSAGYDLYKEGQEEVFARLIRSGGGQNYLYSSGKISGNAFFDENGNLVVEYLDGSSGQLVTVVYRKS